MPDAALIILNANIVTLNPKQPNAQAIAIHDEKIIAVSSNIEIRKHANTETRIVDARGRTIVPGLVDCHAHMTGFGYSLQEVDLRSAKSIAEVQQTVQEFGERNPDRNWILGGRWDQERFAEKRYLTGSDLDAVIKDRPVFLMRVCGHIGVVNTKALLMARITKGTIVKGGEVDLDVATGEPNGILRENALELMWKVVPKPTLKQLQDACLAASKKAVESGLACVHWIVTSGDEIRAIQKLFAEGNLPLRVRLGIAIEFIYELAELGLTTGFGNDMVKIGFVKILADGSLGGRTAALKEPYSDKPETSGMMLYSQRKMNSLVSRAHSAGMQLAIHAIGDRAVDNVLKAYEKALKENPRSDHRHRVEHCSVLNPRLIRKMKHLGLIASVQPHFIVSDFWASDRLGEDRMLWTFPFRTLMHQGIIVISGSDCPVEPISPILGIWGAVARKSLAHEALTVEEALRTYTANAAFASFDEEKLGTIEAGKLADMTMLSDDPFNVRPDDIKNIHIEMTIVNGKIVYSKKAF
jgi:hypothetical protein